MAATSVLAFWLVALLLIVVPGADWAFTISAGLSGHRILPAVGGLVAGYAAVTAVVAAGVGALVAGTPAILSGLTIVGGCYLMWHGAMTFARPATPSLAEPNPTEPNRAEPDPSRSEPDPSRPGPTEPDPTGTGWRTFVKGVGVSGLNPKGLLIFLALLPQFTNSHDAWPVAGQIGVLGLAFMATCAAFYFVLGSLARTVLHARPLVARRVGRFAGAAMVAIGAALLMDHFLH